MLRNLCIANVTSMTRIMTAFAFVLACTPVLEAQTVDREPIDATAATTTATMALPSQCWRKWPRSKQC